jgi:nitroreductase
MVISSGGERPWPPPAPPATVGGMYRPLADDGTVRRLITAAAAAPSIHNTQPWRFVIRGDDVIEVHADVDRVLWVADPHGRALHLSCGAALLNLRLAIRVAGAKPLVWPLPDPQHEPTLIAFVQLADGRPATGGERGMYESIWQRHTSRVPFDGHVLPRPIEFALEQAAEAEHAVLRLLGIRDAALVAQWAAAADRQLARDASHRAELDQWIAISGDDGIPAEALGPAPDSEAAPVRHLMNLTPETARPLVSYELLPQIAVLATERDEPADQLRAGQALQSVLLTATGCGLNASFLYQLIELHDMRDDHGRWWPWPECPQVIIRFGRGPAGAASPRRPAEEILERAVGAAGLRPTSHG